MLSHDCQIRVWYKHTDQMAICHHSNYICYYEAARSEFLRALGMSFAEVERRGIMMPILEVQSKYRKPAYFDELLTVRIILREMPSTRINFFYEIYNERGDLLNTGMTQLGFIHSDSRRPCRCPEWFLELSRSRWTEYDAPFRVRFMPLRRAKRLFLRCDGIFIARKVPPRSPDSGTAPSGRKQTGVRFCARRFVPLDTPARQCSSKFDIAIAYSYLCGSICDNL